LEGYIGAMRRLLPLEGKRNTASLSGVKTLHQCLNSAHSTLPQCNSKFALEYNMFLALLNVHASEGFSFRLLCHPVRSASRLKDLRFGDVMQDCKALAENSILLYRVGQTQLGSF
jgi:hypothetical protein